MKYLLGLVLIIAISGVCFIPDQNEFGKIISLVFIAFLAYAFSRKYWSSNLSFWLVISLIIRFMLIFSFPNLSDDIYRFIWDGRLMHLGINPYSHLPQEIMSPESALYGLIEDKGLIRAYPLLNSQEYFSIYPPISQVIFYLSTWNFIDDFLLMSIFMKLPIFFAEVLTIFLGIRILKEKRLPSENILWYALNPLILIEIMGNLHFEGLMISFFALSLWYFHLKKWNRFAIATVMSIGTKLIPILFLPFFLFQWKRKSWFRLYLVIGIMLILLFLPVIWNFTSFGNSLDLYFQKFEFNASIYFILRALGKLLSGWNLILYIGPGMAILVLLLVFRYARKTVDSFEGFISFALLSLTTYLFLSTTIHPWYLSLGIFISVFTRYRYFIVWSGTVFLSYSLYGLKDYYYGLIFIEYLILAVYLIFETKPDFTKAILSYKNRKND